MSNSTTKQSDSESQRYNLLMQVLQHGLRRSRQTLPSSAELVEASYGEDASVFGGKEILTGTMDDMLDRVQESVDQRIRTYLKEEGQPNNMETFFVDLESKLNALQAQDQAQKDAEQEDQTSAKQALESAVLPTGVTLEDVMAYYQYQEEVKQRDALQEHLAQVNKEVAALQEEHQSMQESIKAQQESLQKVAQDLTRSADVCSMVAH